MTLETATYLYKTVIVSAILYGYYYLALRNRFMHTWNRFFLLAIFIVSILTPLINLPAFTTTANFQPAEAIGLVSDGSNLSFLINATQSATLQPLQWAFLIYIVISLFFAGSLLFTLLRIIRLRRQSTTTTVANIILVHTDARSTPFSFFNYIFWNNNINPDSIEGKKIMQHEITHVQQLHSLDRLLVNILMLFFWINPVFWLVRKELFLVHEFIADQKSIHKQDVDEFATLLLAVAFPFNHKTITTHFFTSSIKRRLNMITNQQKTLMGNVCRLLTLPLALFVLLAFSAQNKTAAFSYHEQKTATANNFSPTSIHTNLQDTVKASFPGGEKAWLTYIVGIVNQHIDSLQTAGITGTALVSFIVDESGRLSDFKTLQLNNSYLAQLLTEGLQKSPRWEPATINGKKIKSLYKQPLTFQLAED